MHEIAVFKAGLVQGRGCATPAFGALRLGQRGPALCKARGPAASFGTARLRRGRLNHGAAAHL
ncbi:hypothetical protein [Paracoccus aminophilus]|uniref:hypothetical protein n=1 Tax=Paracoccus aminophilus TaxID=34003 RepID=UPI00040B019D|nr:hypothetical protein [Paracoccus aminophilus]